MDVLICSVSGGSVISQIAGLHCLLKNGYKPDTTMGASGGSITILCLTFCQMRFERIPMFLELLSSKIFVEEWLKPFPWWTIGPFQGSAYRHTFGSVSMINTYFFPYHLDLYETWILTYNQTKCQPHLFTNRAENGKIKPQGAIITSFNGDLDLYAKSLLASSCIPGILPPVEILGDMHIDGGAYASSPISLAMTSLQKEKMLHLIFLTGADSEITTEDRDVLKPTIIDVTTTCVDALYRNSVRRDRISCLNLLSHYGDIIELKDCSLENALKCRKDYLASLIEIYPSITKEIDITSFESKDAIDLFNEQKEIIKCRIWVAIPPNHPE
jgi:predicted acylesterase/phospholipase RssA